MILLSTAFILYLLACVFVPCFLYIFIQRFLLHKKASFLHLFWVSVFLLYICMVLEVTGIGSIWDIGSYPGIIMKDKINLIPFPDGLEMSGILNIIMFMPLGFLLPLLWKEYHSFWETTLCGFFFSFGIEFCQLFNNRVSDINDLISVC